MKSIIRLFLLVGALLFSGESLLYAQQPQPIVPDCVIFFTFTTNTGDIPTGTGFDNRSAGCTIWTLGYTSIGFTPVSITFQSANGPLTPGAFGTYIGTVANGINPNTSVTSAVTEFTSCPALPGTCISTPWVRVDASLTGAGTVRGWVFGYRTGSPGSGGGGGGGGICGTIATPCVVDGVTAAGAPPTTSPVLGAGQDGTNVQTLKTDTNGSLIPSNSSTAGIDGVSNTNTGPTGAAGAVLFQKDILYRFNGATLDRDFVCNQQAAITLTAATDVVLVAGTVGTTIRICHISLSSDTSAAVTLRQGTGATCGMNQAVLAGAYQNTVALALDFTPEEALRTTTTNRDVCLHTSLAATAGGIVIFAQF